MATDYHLVQRFNHEWQIIIKVIVAISDERRGRPYLGYGGSSRSSCRVFVYQLVLYRHAYKTLWYVCWMSIPPNGRLRNCG